jgi:hypothetical protein
MISDVHAMAKSYFDIYKDLSCELNTYSVSDRSVCIVEICDFET